MPSGDRSMTWFPEMVEQLRQAWRGDLGFDELIALAQSLDHLLQDIRAKRQIEPVVFYCRHCGRRHPAAASRVSVRAMILAAGRFGIGAQADVQQLESLWKRHRSAQGLDLYGRPTVAAAGGSTADTAGAAGDTSSAAGPQSESACAADRMT